MKTVTIGVLIGFGALFISQGYAQDVSTTQKGKELFNKHCASCHGEAAVGQSKENPKGGLDKNKNRLAPALNGTGHAWHHSPSWMYKYIQEGSIDESSPMPSFRDSLSENEIKTIIMYIQSLWPEKILQQYRKKFGEDNK